MSSPPPPPLRRLDPLALDPLEFEGLELPLEDSEDGDDDELLGELDDESERERRRLR